MEAAETQMRGQKVTADRVVHRIFIPPDVHASRPLKRCDLQKRKLIEGGG